MDATIQSIPTRQMLQAVELPWFINQRLIRSYEPSYNTHHVWSIQVLSTRNQSVINNHSKNKLSADLSIHVRYSRSVCQLFVSERANHPVPWARSAVHFASCKNYETPRPIILMPTLTPDYPSETNKESHVCQLLFNLSPELLASKRKRSSK